MIKLVTDMADSWGWYMATEVWETGLGISICGKGPVLFWFLSIQDIARAYFYKTQ